MNSTIVVIFVTENGVDDKKSNCVVREARTISYFTSADEVKGSLGALGSFGH